MIYLLNFALHIGYIRLYIPDLVGRGSSFGSASPGMKYCLRSMQEIPGVADRKTFPPRWRCRGWNALLSVRASAASWMSSSIWISSFQHWRGMIICWSVLVSKMWIFGAFNIRTYLSCTPNCKLNLTSGSFEGTLFFWGVGPFFLGSLFLGVSHRMHERKYQYDI